MRLIAIFNNLSPKQAKNLFFELTDVMHSVDYHADKERRFDIMERGNGIELHIETLRPYSTLYSILLTKALKLGIQREDIIFPPVRAIHARPLPQRKK